MSARELGPYLLFHRLAEDALSETYRAGLRSGDDVERVVLLCLFKGDQDDVAWLAETALVGRRALAGVESPLLADIVDSGEVEGRAFLAYDYIPGVSLSHLLNESRREGLAVPLELALLIAERAAKGLSAAWEHESRMLHGFLVPPLIMVSNEGGVRLLGFEVASRLRRLFKHDAICSELRAYLPPEVVAQGQPATTDDVYSLGALLFDLLTGAPPPTEQSAVDSALETATFVDDSPLPEEIRSLLISSLALPQKRAGLQAWNHRLGEIVLSGRYGATSFNLAFYLHRLFGDELEKREAGEEVDAPVDEPFQPQPAGSPAPETGARQDQASVSASSERGSHEEDESEPGSPAQSAPAVDFAIEEHDEGDDRPGTAEVREEGSEERPARQRYFAIAASIAVLLLVIAGATLFTGDDEAPSRTASTDVPAASPELPSLQPLSQPTLPDELRGEAGTADSESEADAEPATGPPRETSGGKQRGASRVATSEPARGGGGRAGLPTVDAAEREAAEPRTTGSGSSSTPGASGDGARTPAGSSEPAPVTSADASGPPAGPVEAPGVEPEESTNSVGQASDEAPLETGTAVPEPDDPGAIPGVGDSSEPLLSDAGEEKAGRSPDLRSDLDEAATTSPADVGDGGADEATEIAVPPEEPVRRGELVSPGPDVVAPRLVEAVQPSYPIMARRLKKRATIEVRVLIDENGAVARVEQVGEPAGFGFDEEALKAVRKMSWEPATKDGVPVKMWTKVRLAFQP